MRQSHSRTAFAFLLSAAIALVTLTKVHAADATAAAKQNIIFVLFDDMGYGQPQSYNAGSALRTPNLDRFAQQGMRFTDAHTGAAVCTPTRYGVLTTFSKPIIPTNRLRRRTRRHRSEACARAWLRELSHIAWDAKAPLVKGLKSAAEEGNAPAARKSNLKKHGNN